MIGAGSRRTSRIRRAPCGLVTLFISLTAPRGSGRGAARAHRRRALLPPRPSLRAPARAPWVASFLPSSAPAPSDELELVADGYANVRVVREDTKHAEAVGRLRFATIHELPFEHELQVSVHGRVELGEPELLVLENVGGQEDPDLGAALVVELPARADEEVALEGP